MRILLMFVLVSCSLGTVFSQKEDYNWVMGGLNDMNSLSYSEVLGLFVIDTFQVSNYSILYSNASISDQGGNLLLFTNGVDVINKNYNYTDKGDSLNFGYISNFYQHYKITAFQGTFFLSSLSDSLNVVAFHLFVDTIFNNTIFEFNSAVLQLRMSEWSFDSSFVGNNLYINKPIISDTLVPAQFTACRHGNGRDWWIVSPEANTNCYYVLLYTPDSIYVKKECIGWEHHYNEIGMAVFSPDGSTYARGSSYNGVEVLDFDRCTGTFSNLRQIPYTSFILSSDVSRWAGYISISPNSRFLYINVTYMLMQADLDLVDPSQQIDTIAINDFSNPTGIFAMAQLGPNGKIYISNGVQSGPKYLRVIENPNEFNPDVEMYYSLPYNPSYAPPNNPNYRLGAKEGSACDTIVSAKEMEILTMGVYPNPAIDVVRIEYGLLGWKGKQQLELAIADVTGRLHIQKQLPAFSAWQDVDVRNLSSGMYHIQIKDKKTVLGVGKLLKE